MRCVIKSSKKLLGEKISREILCDIRDIRENLSKIHQNFEKFAGNSVLVVVHREESKRGISLYFFSLGVHRSLIH